MTRQPGGSPSTRFRSARVDPIAVVLFAIGVFLLLRISRLNFLSQDANWDLLNYHAYVPASLLDGSWFSAFHPAGIQSYLTPYQDLLQWPLMSGLPAPIATAVLVAVQVSIFVPLGLILQTTVPGLSRSRALAVGLIGVSGAMTMTELGGTMGDIPPAVLVAWALFLLLSVLAGQAPRAERRAALAGVLVGAAVALKLTVAYLAPGLLVIAVLLVLAGNRRSGLVFVLVAPAVAMILYAPWAFVLQGNVGSPVFPLFNAIFQAPRFPATNFQDARFPVTSLVDLANLPIRQGLGTAVTAELQFTDVRWVVAMLAVGLGVGVAALRALGTGARLRRPDRLPALALLGFWLVSYAVWALVFGVQRYVVLLEVLALPVIAIGVSLALPRLPTSPASLLMLILLAAILGGTTKIVDFGRRPMGWAPLVPTETIEPLSRYDAVVIAAPPLAYLRAVTRNAPGASGQTWLGVPFNDADRVVAEEALRGKSIGILFYSTDRASVEGSASTLGLRVTDECLSFESPVPGGIVPSSLEVCTASPSPP
jgi:hypothetical protein